jgi:hypothetical protein
MEASLSLVNGRPRCLSLAGWEASLRKLGRSRAELEVASRAIADVTHRAYRPPAIPAQLGAAHIVRTAEITVRVPRAQALALFTPEGERRWADGWDPQYPEPERREGSGAVFITQHGGHQTTWIIVDQSPEGIRYARVVAGMTAGTIAVEVLGSANGATRVRVTYDLTALSAAGSTWLEAFSKHYETGIEEWSHAIDAALQGAG